MNWSNAVETYRDSPNTFGHEEVQDKRDLLKKVLGAIGSQRHLQDSLTAALADGYCDESLGIRHLWDRLKASEDFLRECEESSGEPIAQRKYLTYPGPVHSVPTIAEIQLRMSAMKWAEKTLEGMKGGQDD